MLVLSSNPATQPSKRSTKSSQRRTPEQIARACIAEARNNPMFGSSCSTDRAIALAGRYAHGAKLRWVIRAIGEALNRKGAARKGRRLHSRERRR